MFERILNLDSNGHSLRAALGLSQRPARVGSLLALGLTVAFSVAACSEDTPATPEGRDNDSINGDDDEDKVAETKPDSGKKPTPGKDAGATTGGDDDGDGDDNGKDTPTDVADAGKTETPVTGTSSSLWCKAKAISDKRCASCHQPDMKGTGPMALVTAEDYLADAPTSKGKQVHEVALERLHDAQNPMPPKGNLTADEIATLDAYLKAGAPKGDDPTCENDKGVVPETPVEAWPPKECDAVYKILSHAPNDLTKPYQVPGNQETHDDIVVDAPWGDEKVQAIAFRPITDNPAVMHHWILYTKARAFLTGWAPGEDEANALPPDIGMNMPTGKGALTLNLHYFNTSSSETKEDMSGLEVCVVKGANLRKHAAAVTMSFTSFGSGFVMAPAGAKDKPITGTCNVTTTSPVHLMSASPHAHTYARRMKFTVQKKDGTEIVMHDGVFKFGEQQSYKLEPDVIIETGDKVMTSCYYTNDTNKNVTFGESTTDEMCFNFARYWPAGALSCGGLGSLIPAGFGGP